MNINHVSRDDYLKLIDIVTDPKHASNLTKYLAIQHPAILLEFHNHGDYSRYIKVIGEMRKRQKVAAIKELRMAEGLALLEAKRCIDFALQDPDYEGTPTEDDLMKLNVLGIARAVRCAYERGW